MLTRLITPSNQWRAPVLFPPAVTHRNPAFAAMRFSHNVLRISDSKLV
ncbi:MAG: hypothetical protein LUO93_10475 [Methanomicrobiales archaeon]|nr:hypothetical protein [Methanomicrobiales archaeon]